MDALGCLDPLEQGRVLDADNRGCRIDGARKPIEGAFAAHAHPPPGLNGTLPHRAVDYAAFLLISLLVICTPGQDTALTIRNTLIGGRRAGVATAAGVSAGQAVWTLATSAGLAVRLAGAAYLIYLGVRSLLGAVATRSDESRPAQPSHRGAFWQGLLSNLSN